MNRPRGTTVAAACAVVLATAGGLLSVAPSASAAAVTCASPVFKRTFYANTTFSGTPKRTDCDSTINENWGNRAPGYKGMPANKFGVRWSMSRDFGSGGPFSFTVSARDGIRVYLDGVRKIDVWKDGSATVTRTVNVTVPKGKHSLRVDYVNWTGAANVKFGYAPRTSASVDKVKPLVPTGTTVRYDATSTSTKVSWAKNKEMDLAGYRVYRRLKGASFPSKPIATTTATSWTDTTVPKDGYVYYYEVRAYDKAGNTSSGTADIGITTVDRTAPAAPKGVDKNWSMNYPDRVTLYWDENKEPDLAGYRVYRSTTLPVALTPENLLSGDEPTYYSYYSVPVPQTGDVYYYVVTAVDTHGLESAASSYAMYYTRDKTPPVETAFNLRAEEGEAGVMLTWDPSEGTSRDFAGYSVFRRRATATTGTAPEEVGKGVKGTTFTDVAPPPGTTYIYYVISLDHAGNGGPSSDKVTVAVTGNTTAPAALTGLTATPEENGVTLSWDASDAPGLTHYRVLRGTLSDGQWTYAPVEDPTTRRPREIKESTFHDMVPADGQEARYAVVGVDQYGNQLAPETGATVVAVTALDLRPTAPPATGGPFSFASAGTSGYISWGFVDTTGNENGSPATDILVRRWNPQTGEFDLINTSPSNSGSSYWDLTQPSATTVYYRLSVRYADGTESAATEAVAVTY
ncbi:PA14 domain-containing protein [Streptomyces sp. NPDC058770]|uniref:PA14 domain-containing protein n=1 Tax=Streptomyces sp. NPDC058770 TaxID=3346631 RepID=UPI003684327D